MGHATNLRILKTIDLNVLHMSITKNFFYFFFSKEKKHNRKILIKTIYFHLNKFYLFFKTKFKDFDYNKVTLT